MKAQEFRAQAAQARWLAARALSDENKNFWLRLATEWQKLALQAELYHALPVTLQSIRRTATMSHLLRAEQHVMEGERHVGRQREIVAKFERADCKETGRARELLAQFEQTQAMHIADRDRPRNELAYSGAADAG